MPGFRWVLSALLVTALSPCPGRTETAPLLAAGTAAFDQALAAWDAAAFRRAAELFTRAADAEPDNPVPLYWRGATAFQMAVLHLHGFPRDRDPAAARIQVEEGLRALDRALRLNPGDAETLALRGALRGLKIQLDPLNIFLLGPGAQSDRELALKNGPENPRAHYLAGVGCHFSPVFLGERRLALAHLLRAEQLFAAEPLRASRPEQPAWGYAHCLLFIGDVWAEDRRPDRAREYYRKALTIRPGDARARERLR